MEAWYSIMVILAPRDGVLLNAGVISLKRGSQLAVDGDFIQLPDGQLDIAARSADPDSGHGKVNATGSVVLAGHYRASYVDGYVPDEGTFFDVLSAGNVIQGAFDTSELPDSRTGDRTLLVYEAARVRMLSTDEADADLNGSVDTRDFILYLNRWAAGESWADVNGDGVVDSRDFIYFLNQWANG
jgi:hypothetical protein